MPCGHEAGRERGGRVQRPGAAVGAHRHPAHRLDAAGEDQVLEAAAHPGGGLVDGLEPGGAEAVELHAGDGVGVAGGERRGLGDVAALVADRARRRRARRRRRGAGRGGVAVPDLVEQPDDQVDRLHLVQGSRSPCPCRAACGCGRRRTRASCPSSGEMCDRGDCAHIVSRRPVKSRPGGLPGGAQERRILVSGRATPGRTGRRRDGTHGGNTMRLALRAACVGGGAGRVGRRHRGAGRLDRDAGHRGARVRRPGSGHRRLLRDERGARRHGHGRLDRAPGWTAPSTRPAWRPASWSTAPRPTAGRGATRPHHRRPPSAWSRCPTTRAWIPAARRTP